MNEEAKADNATTEPAALYDSFAPGAVLKGWAVALWLVAIIAGAIGIWQLFNESKVVGGDAYNYIIGAMRGVGWICFGVLCGVLACALILFSIRNRFDQPRP